MWRCGTNYKQTDRKFFIIEFSVQFISIAIDLKSFIITLRCDSHFAFTHIRYIYHTKEYLSLFLINVSWCVVCTIKWITNKRPPIAMTSSQWHRRDTQEDNIWSTSLMEWNVWNYKEILHFGYALGHVHKFYLANKFLENADFVISKRRQWVWKTAHENKPKCANETMLIRYWTFEHFISDLTDASVDFLL